jgi:mono/diheme cytochrome c family protein
MPSVADDATSAQLDFGLSDRPSARAEAGARFARLGPARRVRHLDRTPATAPVRRTRHRGGLDRHRTLSSRCSLAAHPALPERPAGPLEFDAGTVQRGAGLAAVGNGASCHTAAFSAPYAGGVALATPYGTIHGTNITPDPETGIGRGARPRLSARSATGSTAQANRLYPAFPYEHFTRITDGGLNALYAFMMTHDPMRAANVANVLRVPFGFRPLVAGRNLLFLRRGPQATADATRDADWDRGAYLAGSLGHCGSCHTPRNALGAEERGRALDGGDAEGWYAPALDGQSPSPLPWTADELSAYPRTGIAGDHAIASGPIQQVVASLAGAPVDDVHALATYVVSLLAAAQPLQQARAGVAQGRIARGALASAPTPDANRNDAAALQLGGAAHAGACARCHDRGRDMSSNGALQLPLAIAVHDPDPRSLSRIVRDGIVPLPSQPGRFMPASGTSLSDEKLVALFTYLRASALDTAPWPDLTARVRDSRSP